MPRPSQEQIRADQEQADVLLELLITHADSPVTITDIKEEAPPIYKWDGRIGFLWGKLISRPDLEDRLVPLGEGSTRAYAYLSTPNKPEKLRDRTLYMAGYLADPAVDNTEAPEKVIRAWKKRAAVAAGIVSLVAGGSVIGILHKKNNK